MALTKSIFIVEDDANISYIYKTALKKAGITDVEIISSSGEAMEKIKEIQTGKKQKPALMLLDLGLPDINSGLDILNAIRKNSVTKDITIFILSNYTDELREIFLNSKEAKPDKFLLKTSIMPSKLVELVKKQIEK